VDAGRERAAPRSLVASPLGGALPWRALPGGCSPDLQPTFRLRGALEPRAAAPRPPRPAARSSNPALWLAPAGTTLWTGRRHDALGLPLTPRAWPTRRAP